MSCLNAAEALAKSGINARVIDPFTVKPLDVKLIIEHGNPCGGRVVVVENHYQQGGLGEAVLSVLAEQRNFVVKHLYVPQCHIPVHPPFIDMFGVSAKRVINAAEASVQNSATNNILHLHLFLLLLRIF